MSTHDPFLRQWKNFFDRGAAWLVLSLVFSAVIWAAAWERGLHLPTRDGWMTVYAFLTGQATDRISMTLLALCALSGVLLATVASGWLFRRWQRQGELRVHHLRGSEFED
jgi:uncharacterized membrane protein